MTRMPPITVDFRIGEERYARRYWHAVPRTGEFVLLGAGKDRFPADQNGDAMFRVLQVTWGAESKIDAISDKQVVIVHVEHVK